MIVTKVLNEVPAVGARPSSGKVAWPCLRYTLLGLNRQLGSLADVPMSPANMVLVILSEEQIVKLFFDHHAP